MRNVLLAVLLASCAPASFPDAPVDAGAEAAPLPPMVPDADEPRQEPRCLKSQVVWIGKRRYVEPVPCKEFDRRSDLGMPLP